MKFLVKIINALITIINIIFALLELYSHKWVLIVLVLSALVNTVLIGYGLFRVGRKWFGAKKTETTETETE